LENLDRDPAWSKTAVLSVFANEEIMTGDPARTAVISSKNDDKQSIIIIL
jgi:hypothetical protein